MHSVIYKTYQWQCGGMRVGELITLQPDEIDFDRCFIEVQRNCVFGRAGTSKSGKSRRLEMSVQLALVLKEYLTNRRKEALKKGWGEPQQKKGPPNRLTPCNHLVELRGLEPLTSSLPVDLSAVSLCNNSMLRGSGCDIHDLNRTPIAPFCTTLRCADLRLRAFVHQS